MQPHTTPSTNHEPVNGLPPVAPPDARFLAKLFVIPLFIVVGLVGLAVGVIWLRDVSMTPEAFLERLDSSNPEERWRGAEDLAQVLLRDDRLAANPHFALELSERLRQSWRSVREAEQTLEQRLQGSASADREQERKSLEPEQNYLLYLSACLGNSMIPAGVPTLTEMALEDEGGDPRDVARRRWRAIWALANLGANVKRFDELSEERQQALLAELGQEAQGSAGERAEAARLALDMLRAREAGQPLTGGVAVALATCAKDERNPFLREMVAFALNFWEGNAAENALIEATLLRLAHDDGRGADILADAYQEHRDVQPVTRIPGLEIRYNATLALARKGSDKARLDILAEMLDEEQQLQNFRMRRKDGTEGPDENLAYSTLRNALRAVVELYRKNPGRDLSALQPALERLTRSANPAVQAEAERAREALQGNPSTED